MQGLQRIRAAHIQQTDALQGGVNRLIDARPVSADLAMLLPGATIV